MWSLDIGLAARPHHGLPTDPSSFLDLQCCHVYWGHHVLTQEVHVAPLLSEAPPLSPETRTRPTLRARQTYGLKE